MLCCFRANIESSYSRQVAQQRMQYTQEDREVIKEFLEAKKSFNLKSQSLIQMFAFQEGFKGESLYYGKNDHYNPVPSPLSFSLSLSLSLSHCLSLKFTQMPHH